MGCVLGRNGWGKKFTGNILNYQDCLLECSKRESFPLLPNTDYSSHFESVRPKIPYYYLSQISRKVTRLVELLKFVVWQMQKVVFTAEYFTL